MRADARRRDHEIDREAGWFALLDAWLEDDGCVLPEFQTFVLDAATLRSDRKLLAKLTADELSEMPLVFPIGAEDDVHRLVLNAQRRRLEALLGAIQAADTSEPADAKGPPSRARVARQERESAFLRNPSAAGFHALKQFVDPMQWHQVRRRVLAHLQKHQREPSLVFRLYRDEGMLLDADGLAFTQHVDPDDLVRGAMDVKDEHPAMAAGWLVMAAHRLADRESGKHLTEVINLLVLVRDLASRANQNEQFGRVLRLFRSRHAHSDELMGLLNEVGL